MLILVIILVLFGENVLLISVFCWLTIHAQVIQTPNKQEWSIVYGGDRLY